MLASFVIGGGVGDLPPAPPDPGLPPVKPDAAPAPPRPDAGAGLDAGLPDAGLIPDAGVVPDAKAPDAMPLVPLTTRAAKPRRR